MAPDEAECVASREMKSFVDLASRGGLPAHRRLFDQLRQEIQNGHYAPGTRLPSTRQLAKDWGTSPVTAHNALRALAKEGWVERRPQSGTFVADLRNRFCCAGIFHCAEVGSLNSFGRYLHFALLDRLQALDKTAETFTDSRPEAQQDTLFPPLVEALAQRRIQCLIALSLNSKNAVPLARLSVPTAFTTNPYSRNTLDANHAQLFAESARRLAAQGCRSVGILCNVQEPGRRIGAFPHYYDIFKKAVEKEGLTTRDEWIRRPTFLDLDWPRMGYRQLKALCRLPKQPDGLIVTPDLLAQGAIIAILELRAAARPPKMKFVFHSNRQFPYLCPFPVTWAVYDLNKQAEGLVNLIERQFAGETPQPSFFDFDFHYGSSDATIFKP